MNVVHIIDLISQKYHGGAAQACFHLAEAQARQGHTVTIISSNCKAKDQEAPQGVRLIKLRCLDLFGKVRITPGLVFREFGDTDIIHLHTFRTFMNIVAANTIKPCVLQAHGCMPQYSFTNPVQDIVWKNLVFKRALRYLASTEHERTQYMEYGADPKDISIVPMGIDLREFCDIPERQPSNQKKILFVGRLHEIKGLDLLIESFSRITEPGIILQIAGPDDGYEAEARNAVHVYGMDKRIQFLGGVYGRGKLQLYVNADVVVVPSRYESFGISWLESLACGTPVILTDACAAANLLPPFCGQVVPRIAGNMAHAILDSVMWSDQDRESRRHWAFQFDWGNIAEDVLMIYEDVLRG